MSTAPRYPADMGYAGLRMTADEFLALGETPERYELIDGVVLMSPSPTPRHQLVLRYLLRGLEATAEGRKALIVPDADLRLARGMVYRPDLCIFAQGRLPAVPERLDVPPDLVVEILSPGSKPLDLITKRDDYEVFGVSEYWVVDPESVTVRLWRRIAGKQGGLLEAAAQEDAVECASLPGVRVDLNAIRAEMGMD